ncbi:uncharacterized protein UTRI_03419 [Ustilago trichophora]|uniref:RING-type domain-containing protein n=1 Tax=Ustilago trichophora TaxID=86804 RepID=A0A5C3E3X7_9BASI|nr:uncharacterized protein UTRI_03419 [Ustilago trichophora]
MEGVTRRTSPRRRTSNSEAAEETSVQVVIEPNPLPSTSKLPARNKRDRKPSSSRDTVTPPPHADEPSKKMSTRLSPGKDTAAASKPTASMSPSSKTNAKQNVADASSSKATAENKSPSTTSGSDEIKVVSPSRRSNSKRKVGVPTKSEDPPIKNSPTSKRPTDLANELFKDDEERVGDGSPAAVEADVSSNVESDGVELVIPPRKRRRAGSDDSQVDSHPSSASFSTAVDADPPRINATDAVSLQLRIRQLEIQLAESKAKTDQNAGLISAQHSIFENLHGQCICHICLEPSFRPCVLAPCGHVFCIHCLRSWFTKPLASEAAAPQGWSQPEIERYNRTRTLKRKKICPSCRTELACPPVEVYLVRDMLDKVDEGLKLSKQANLDSQVAESSTAMLGQDDKARLKGQDLPKGAKLWEDIFDQDGPRRIIFDEVDGVPRCGSCGSEIFDGACSNPSCGIEYDSLSDYEEFRGGEWDDVGDFDSDMDSEGDDDGIRVPRRARRNGVLADRLAEFEARHGGSEAMHRGNRLDRPDDSEGITYIDSSDNEHVVRAYAERDRQFRGRHGGRDGEDEDEDEDDEEMDDFIVRDDFEEGEGEDTDRPNYFDGSDSEDEGSNVEGYGGYHDEEEDDFLPGPRRGGRGSTIEISDSDEGEERDSSVEYRGRRGGRRVADDDDNEDDDDDDDGDEEEGVSDSGDQDMHSESDAGGHETHHLGSSTDSSARRRRARIVDDEDDDDE